MSLAILQKTNTVPRVDGFMNDHLSHSQHLPQDYAIQHLLRLLFFIIWIFIFYYVTLRQLT